MHHRTSMHRDAEAAFAIYESNNPVGIEHSAWNGSFLLIVRTGRIFTIHADTLNNGCDKDEYRQILGCPSIQWGFSTAKIDRYSSRFPHVAMERGPYLHPSAS